MDFHRNPSKNSASSSTSSASSAAAHHQPPPSSATDNDPMHSWWESVSKQRSRILSLAALLPSDGVAVSSLADSDRPAVSLLSSPSAYSLISSALSSPKSGSGSDRLCQWLYETFQSSDPHLRLLVLSFLPLLSGIYLSRVHSSDSSSLPSLAGFEAVLLAVYSSEAKSRAGKPLLVQIPDLSQPSLYHAPRNKPVDDRSRQYVGVLSPPLEPHLAVKSTKRAIIVGTALDCYYKQVSQMPAWSKLDFCKFAAVWAGQDCPCRTKLDRDEDNHHENGNVNGNGHIRLLREDSGFSNGTRSGDGDEVDYEDDVIKEVVVVEMSNLGINEENLETKGVRIPLPWELLRPVVTILGHCLFGPSNSQDVKDSASVAVRCLYARATHDLAPQAILALRSLIRLDKNARAAATTAATVTTNASSNANTPSKAKKPEILLVSK